jgi:hypothetical protein
VITAPAEARPCRASAGTLPGEIELILVNDGSFGSDAGLLAEEWAAASGV